MPKPPARDNRRGGKPSLVKDLLSKAGLGPGAASARSRADDDLRASLERVLPGELSTHIAALTVRDGRLVVYVESAAWSARLRYALAEHWPAVQYAQPELREWAVKVQPAAASAGART